MVVSTAGTPPPVALLKKALLRLTSPPREMCEDSHSTQITSATSETSMAGMYPLLIGEFAEWWPHVSSLDSSDGRVVDCSGKVSEVIHRSLV